ncbi:unnamed protein product, partial [Mycena citricolor]
TRGQDREGELCASFPRGNVLCVHFRSDAISAAETRVVARSQKKNALLADLDALDSAGPADSSSDGTVDALVEPHPTLPLGAEWIDSSGGMNGCQAVCGCRGSSVRFASHAGIFQSSTFNVPPSESEEVTPADYTIISRRSRDRAGLRYQRGGIDDDAHVANFVETETILRLEREGHQIFSHMYSSGALVSPFGGLHTLNCDVSPVPLFWTQTGLALKPPPVLATDRTHAQNLDAIRRHFLHAPSQDTVLMLVGPVLNSRDGLLTGAYRDYMAELAEKDAVYHEYDFHQETKGMKYENISQLIDTMERTFEQQVWANNGDAISRAYAGTSALKGDFTRTGKRDLSGMLNDGVNSLARMYTSTFSDWFSQAVIDFTLGNRTISVFSEFLLKLQSTDPRDLIRGERLLSGWTVFGPEELNAKIGDKFEEKVLLLFLHYIISYDYTLEKVKMYTRIPLETLPRYQRLLDPQHSASPVSLRFDLQEQVFGCGCKHFTHLPSSLGRATGPASSSMTARMMGPTVPMTNSFAAFKTLPIDPTRSRRDSSISSLGGSAYLDSIDELGNASCCREAADLMVDGIRRACEDIGNDADLVVDQDVVSLSEAQRMTSMYAKMEYGVKRLLWLGG